MGRPFGVHFERRHDRPSVVRRRARTGQSPDPRAADICPVGPRAAPLPRQGQAPRSSPGVARLPGRFPRVHLVGRPVETDPSAAGWIAAALTPADPPTVASLVPPVFAAYARVLHPAIRYEGDDDVDVRWPAVAALNDRSAHRLMQWPAITGSWDFIADDDQPELWNDSPAEGHLPAPVADRLAAVLAGHTATPDDCWFGAWADAPSDPGLLVLGARAYRLVRGPIGLAAANFAPEPAEQGPNLWFPADRAWYVVTDIDLMSTYVGGSAAVVAAVLAEEGIDAWPAGPGDPVTPDSDPVNPPPT